MGVNPDFRDLFFELNAAEARYLVVGAYAVTFHSRPRFTKDLDVLVDPTPENAARVHAALRAFGAPLKDVTPKDLATPGIVFQIGVAPNRIDILTSIGAVEFGPAWKRRVDSTYGDCAIHVLSREDLIANKRAVGRPQDLVDLRELEAGDKQDRRRRRR
jgi:hypothetical protein